MNVKSQYDFAGSGAVGRTIFRRMDDSSNVERFFVE